MGAKTIKRDPKVVRQMQRETHRRMAAGPLAYVTVIQHNETKEVLAVLADRSQYDAVRDKAAARGISFENCELIDKPLGTI